MFIIEMLMFSLFLYVLESERLQQDLLKVEQLEGKVGTELQTLRDQLELMTRELHTYRDLDALKAAGEDRKKVTTPVYTRSNWTSLTAFSVYLMNC